MKEILRKMNMKVMEHFMAKMAKFTSENLKKEKKMGIFVSIIKKGD